MLAVLANAAITAHDAAAHLAGLLETGRHVSGVAAKSQQKE
jgi:hypothetical protein